MDMTTPRDHDYDERVAATWSSSGKKGKQDMEGGYLLFLFSALAARHQK